ncbi:MAG: kelch repeat-containing protein [Methanoregula sp.]
MQKQKMKHDDAVSQVVAVVLLIVLLAGLAVVTAGLVLSPSVIDQLPIAGIGIEKTGRTISLSHYAGDILPRENFKIFADGTDITDKVTKQGGNNWNSWSAGETLEYHASPFEPVPKQVTVVYFGTRNTQFLLAGRGSGGFFSSNDWGDQGKISDTTFPVVQVQSPNGGETIPAGGQQAITWTATDNIGVTAIDLEYSLDNGAAWQTIVTGIVNTGSYTWTTPATASNQVRVRVSAYDACVNGARDISDNVFTILPPLVAAFHGTPTSGVLPLTVQFTDDSTGGPTGWAWFFGDETYTQPWTQQTTAAAWSARSVLSSVVMPDGSIVLMGGQSNNGKMNDVWRSTDNGATWTQMTASAGWSARSVLSSVAMPDGSIVMMGGQDSSGYYLNDVWRSTDNGATWTQVNAGAGWSPRIYHTTVVMPDGSIVLMGGTDGSLKNDVWRSTDNGASWTQVNASAGWSPRKYQNSVAMPDGSIVMMGGSDGSLKNDVWRSTDNGASWTQVNAGAGWSPRMYQNSVKMPDGSIVLMGGYDGTYRNDMWRSTDNGVTWTQVNAGAGWTGRAGSNSVALPDGSVALLGGYSGTYKNDVWGLQLADSASATQGPSHTYSVAGTYTVTLQVSNAYGSDSTQKIGYITVTNP